ncbi:hypothetical protein [Pseudopedobacter beijingensis]|uniref:YD repeat-containing protein n=1 Tax=Pseudopedobacter beijingensis TaxID=1207056 RepID=A0ABW4IG05_9SPHI
MNADGAGTSTVGRDAYAYSLGYYQGDYNAIGGSGAPAFGRSYAAAPGDITGKNLYNGNISHSTYAIREINSGQPAGYTYGYDQLNRLKRMRQHHIGPGTGNWNSQTLSPAYSEDFSYDANGNIQTLDRMNGGGTVMDNLSYSYDTANGRNNRLTAVADAVGVWSCYL